MLYESSLPHLDVAVTDPDALVFRCVVTLGSLYLIGAAIADLCSVWA